MGKYYLIESIDSKEYNKHIPSDFDFNNQNHTEIYHFIENGIKTAFENKSHDELRKFVQQVIAMTDKYIGQKYYDEFKFFYHFYKKITTLDYNLSWYDKSHSEFIKEHDFTDVYYTMGKLYAGRNDINRHLHYIDLADSEYALHNNKSKGEFIKDLLKSETLSLWHISAYIINGFENYKNMNNHCSDFENALTNIGIEVSKNTILELLEDFKHDLLIQFIHAEMSIDSFEEGRILKEDSTDKDKKYQSIKRMRYVGELTWLYEIYLKDKLEELEGKRSEDTLSGILSKLLNLINLQSEYKKVKAEYKKFKSKTELNTVGLQELLKELKNTPSLNFHANLKGLDINEFFVKSLYGLLLFRNYYAHYMDRDTKIGRYFSSYNTLRVLIFTVFMTTKMLFDNEFDLVPEIDNC